MAKSQGHGKHKQYAWQRTRERVRAEWLPRLPLPCARCGLPMTREQLLDVGHITRDKASYYDPKACRLEHRSCNRRDGQRITTEIRAAKKLAARMPSW